VNCRIKLANKSTAIAREDTQATGQEMTVMAGQAVCKVYRGESRKKAETV